MSKKQKNRQQKIRFRPVWGVILACVLIVCGFTAGGGVFFERYLNEQIYKERVSQLTESTQLLYTNLENTLDSEWIYISAVISGMNYACTCPVSMKSANCPGCCTISESISG